VTGDSREHSVQGITERNGQRINTAAKKLAQKSVGRCATGRHRAELRLKPLQDARQLGEVDRVDVGPCLCGADAEAVGVAPQHQQRMVAGIVLRFANRPFDERGEGEAAGQRPLVRRNASRRRELADASARWRDVHFDRQSA
jgi:hypothetical protein